MALLNFANNYSEVSSALVYDTKNPPTSGDYVKLYFTKDGHIITHGVDYIPWGNGIIPISKLPISTEPTGNPAASSDKLWDSKTIENKIAQSFIANDAMRFKGTIAYVNANTYTINGTNTTFPTNAQVGDTYRVTASGSYAGHKCEVGDLLICITAESTAQGGWTVAQTNINGQIAHTINGIARYFYSNDSNSFTIYAPTTGAKSENSSGDILISKGYYKAPEWENPLSITVGTANKVAQAISSGVGLTMTSGTNVVTSYNGSAATTIKLVAATTGSLGGVIIDDGTRTGTTTKTPTISVDSNGKIYLTKDNIKNALGYDPVSVNNWRPVYVNGTERLKTGTGTGNLDLCSGSDVIVSWSGTDNKIRFDTNIKVVSSTANGLAPKLVKEATQISQSFYLLATKDGTTTPSWYQLPSYAFTWRTVKINNNDILNSELNLIPGNKITLTQDANTKGKVTISSSWRDIKIGGNSIGDQSLNFMPTGDIYVKVGDQKTSTTNEFDVGFGLAWYNVSTHGYEYE